MTKVQINGSQEIELKDFISRSLTKSEGNEFRDKDSIINYISNIVDNLSGLVTLLFEKNLLSEEDIKKVVNTSDFKILK